MWFAGVDLGSADGDATVYWWLLNGRIIIAPSYLPVEWLDRITPAIDATGRLHLLWTGWNNGQGHGKVRVDGKVRYVYREVVERVTGRKLSRFDYVDHLCTRKRCVNFDCLEVVPPGENTRRGPGRLMQFKPAALLPPPSPCCAMESSDGQ